MNRTLLASRVLGLPLCLALAPACLDDKSLGDLGGTNALEPTGTSSPPEAASSSGDPQTSASVSTAVGSATDPAEDTESETMGGALVCADQSPPSAACEPHGDASFSVEGDVLPEGDDHVCTVLASEEVDELTRAIALECDGSRYDLTLASSAPNLFLYVLEAGADVSVSVSASAIESPALEGLPSFVIRDLESGTIRLAYINALGHELFDGPELDVDIAPLSLRAQESGCAYDSVAETCDGSGSILAQRVSLEFEGEAGEVVSLFDGDMGLIPDGSHGIAVIVERAERIVCWDDDCLGDDSGPFDATEVLILPSPGG